MNPLAPVTNIVMLELHLYDYMGKDKFFFSLSLYLYGKKWLFLRKSR
jgi:hypothetical protein